MNRKVLLVEDDKQLQKALSMRLTSCGYEPITADDVASATSMAVKRKPDLSLIDINLPDGTGFLVAKQIINNPNINDIPVIFTTAYNKPEYSEVVKKYTPLPVLEKPFTEAQLVHCLEMSQCQ